ncbi:MAG: hypothetical protein ABL890_01405 [Candidatus Peribacteraceae bacterium]
MLKKHSAYQALSWSTGILGVLVALVVVAGTMQAPSSELGARLVTTSLRTKSNEIPSTRFTAQHVIEGFSVPADTHVIFDVPQGSNISRNVFFGPESDLIRYWGYCFDGQENNRKRAGKRGMDIYNPERFFYSLAERRAQGSRPEPDNEDLLGILESLHGAAPKEPDSFYNVFYGGETCYVMADGKGYYTLEDGKSGKGLSAGIDTDLDLLNTALERMYHTNPANPDTDGDTIKDGDEVFTVKTNPAKADSDLDGLSDSCEDKNANGQLDSNELSSPLTADSDKDGLCDGNACPEAFTQQRVRVNGQWEWTRVATNPIWSELGIDAQSIRGCPGISSYVTNPRTPTTFVEGDWDYQWRLYIGKSGTEVGDIPIPELP